MRGFCNTYRKTLLKIVRRDYLAVPIGEAFLVPHRALFGSRWNPLRKGFYLEPKRVLQRVPLWGQLKNPFRF